MNNPTINLTKKLSVFIISFLVFVNVATADATASGVGVTRGEALMDAMGKAPSGQWKQSGSPRYSRINSRGNKWICTVTWKNER